MTDLSSLSSSRLSQSSLDKVSLGDTQSVETKDLKTALGKSGLDKVKLADKSKTETSSESTAKRTLGFAQKHPTLAKAVGLALCCVPFLSLVVVFSPETFFGGAPPQPDTDQFKNNTQVKLGYYNDLKDQYGDKLATQALVRAGIDLSDPTKPLTERQVELADQALEKLSRPKLKALYTNDRILDAISHKVAGGSLSDSFTKDEITEMKKTISDTIRDAQPAMSKKGVRSFVAHTLKTRMDQKIADLKQQLPDVPTHKPGTPKDKAPTVPELVSHFASTDTLNELCFEKNGASLQGNFDSSEISNIKNAVEEAIRDSNPTMTRDQARDFTMDLLRTRFEEKLQGVGQESNPQRLETEALLALAEDESFLDEACINGGHPNLSELLNKEQIQDLKEEVKKAIRADGNPMSVRQLDELITDLVIDVSLK